jgi:hypothetical protein
MHARQSISRTVWLALPLALASWASLRAQTEQPYEAFIAANEAELHAGPGRRFYVTARLPRGAAVEVYRKEPAGWLAIRPPEDSFSWVPAAALEATDEPDVFRVKTATPSWIGTLAEVVREHKSMVELNPGELVEALGERVVPGDEGVEQKWIKIAPPAGEFRYVLARDITRSPNAAPVEQDDPPLTQVERSPALNYPEPRPRPPVSAIPLSPAPATTAGAPPKAPRGEGIKLHDLQPTRATQEELSDEDDSRVAPAQFQQSAPPRLDPNSALPKRTDPKPRVSLSPDGFVARKPRPLEGAFTSSTPASSDRTSPESPRIAALTPDSRTTSSPPAASTSTTPAQPQELPQPIGNWTEELAAVDLSLTQILAQPQSTWNFALLKQRVQTLIDQAPDAQQRGQARLMRDKIARFEQAFGVPDNPAPLLAAQAASAAQAAVKPGALPSDPRYDGVGYLQETRAGSPEAQRRVPYQYALVDGEGKLLAFVSPASGFNPRAYLGQQVGVYGRRGFVGDLRAPHIAAEKMIKLR